MWTRRVKDISGTYKPIHCAASTLSARHAALQLYRLGCPLEYLQFQRLRNDRWEDYGRGMAAADHVVDCLGAGPVVAP